MPRKPRPKRAVVPHASSGAECWHCGRRHDHPLGAIGCCLFAPDDHLQARADNKAVQPQHNLKRRAAICLYCGGPSKRTFCRVQCARLYNQNALAKIANRSKHVSNPHSVQAP